MIKTDIESELSHSNKGGGACFRASARRRRARSATCPRRTACRRTSCLSCRQQDAPKRSSRGASSQLARVRICTFHDNGDVFLGGALLQPDRRHHQPVRQGWSGGFAHRATRSNERAPEETVACPQAGRRCWLHRSSSHHPKSAPMRAHSRPGLLPSRAHASLDASAAMLRGTPFGGHHARDRAALSGVAASSSLHLIASLFTDSVRSTHACRAPRGSGDTPHERRSQAP